MASTDWTELTNSITTPSVRRGVTGGGFIPPNGGGTFTYGMRSTTIVNGVVALKKTNEANFDPTPAGKGMSVRGALQRGVSAGASGFQPFLFAGAQGNDVATDNAYLIGLTDGEASKIVLMKGPFLGGCPDVAPGSLGVLRRSTTTIPIGTWVDLRLDMRVNLNGDVVLSMFQNDLGANAVTAPVWAPVPGLEQIIDDALGAVTGTAPYTSGRMGFGCRFSDVGRRVYFDHPEMIRET